MHIFLDFASANFWLFFNDPRGVSLHYSICFHIVPTFVCLSWQPLRVSWLPALFILITVLGTSDRHSRDPLTLSVLSYVFYCFGVLFACSVDIFLCFSILYIFVWFPITNSAPIDLWHVPSCSFQSALQYSCMGWYLFCFFIYLHCTIFFQRYAFDFLLCRNFMCNDLWPTCQCSSHVLSIWIYLYYYHSVFVCFV